MVYNMVYKMVYIYIKWYIIYKMVYYKYFPSDLQNRITYLNPKVYMLYISGAVTLAGFKIINKCTALL